jgi:hypothetical protein
MAEVFGTVSGAIAVIDTTAHAIRTLMDDINGIKDAPATIRNVKTELENVQPIITSLRTALQNDGTVTDDFRTLVQSSNVEKALKTCEESCKNFQSTLRKWLKHSDDAGVDWRDRIKVGFFGEKKLAALTNELNICKSTISMALNGANL